MSDRPRFEDLRAAIQLLYGRDDFQLSGVATADVQAARVKWSAILTWSTPIELTPYADQRPVMHVAWHGATRDKAGNVRLSVVSESGTILRFALSQDDAAKLCDAGREQLELLQRSAPSFSTSVET